MINRKDFDIEGESLEIVRQPRAGVVVSVRLSADEATQLQQIANRRQVKISTIAREALGQYLGTVSSGRISASPWTGTSTEPFSRFELSGEPLAPVARTHGMVSEGEPIVSR